MDFVAEHMLEAPMDARYLAFPQIPSAPESREIRLQGGYLEVGGGALDVSVPMIGVQYFRPGKGDWGLLVGGFYDFVDFSGSGGPSTEQVSFAQPPGLADEFDVDVTEVRGSGAHYGVSVAVTHHRAGGVSWQVGLALETLDVSEYAVEFNSEDLSGTLDYAGRYDMITPYGSLQWTRSGAGNLMHTLRLIAAFPQPRQGFKGRITTPEFDLSGDTDSVGRGTHIPDPFAGIGYTLEGRKSGWRVDLGASLFMLVVEPVIHTGVESPIYLNVSKSLR